MNFRSVAVIDLSGNQVHISREQLVAGLESLGGLVTFHDNRIPVASQSSHSSELSPRVAALLATIGGQYTYDLPYGNGTSLRIALPTLAGLKAFTPSKGLEQIFAECPYHEGYQNKQDILTYLNYFQAVLLLDAIVAEAEKAEAGIGRQFGLLSWAGADEFYPRALQEHIYENTGLWSTWTGTHYDGRNESRLYGQAGFITRDNEYLRAVASFIERYKAGEINAHNEKTELEKLGRFVLRYLLDDYDWYDYDPRYLDDYRGVALAGLVRTQ